MNTGTKVVGAVTVAVIMIGASIWLGRQNQRPSGNEPDPSPIPSPASPATNTAYPSPSGTRPTPPIPQSSPPTTVPIAVSTQSANVTLAATNTGLVTDWNEKIDEALKSGVDDRAAAQSLLKLFPKFPPEGQAEAVQHISNLLPDADYPELGKLMEDATLSEDVLDELIMDLLNRPNKIMLPELVKVAKNPQHAKASEAKDFLELYLEEDYGSDWNLWRVKVDEWLKANPED